MSLRYKFNQKMKYFVYNMNKYQKTKYNKWFYDIISRILDIHTMIAILTHTHIYSIFSVIVYIKCEMLTKVGNLFEQHFDILFN